MVEIHVAMESSWINNFGGKEGKEGGKIQSKVSKQKWRENDYNDDYLYIYTLYIQLHTYIYIYTQTYTDSNLHHFVCVTVWRNNIPESNFNK